MSLLTADNRNYVNMTHPIDQRLQRLDPPLAAGETLEVYFYGNQKPAPGPDPALFMHAFCAAYVRSTEAQAAPRTFSTWVSTEHPTDNMKGHLGGFLTTLHWLTKNSAEAHQVYIYGKTYVAEHLPGQLPKWCSENRPPMWLHKKFLPYFNKGIWRYPNWEVVCLKNSDKPKTKHHRRLNTLAAEAGEELQRRIYDDLQTRYPELDLVECFPTVADDEDEWKRALERDRT